jgi:uncharacterized membrane protein YfcA
MKPTAPTLKQRVAWLVGCIAAGLVIGLLARAFGGSGAWFLAVPVCVALGWLALADPTQCMPPDGARRRDDP